MKSVAPLLALCMGVAEVSGHYIFHQFSLSGKKFAVYEHLRQNYNYNSPVTSLTSKDQVCNVGGLEGTNTTTVDVKAGDTFGFHTDTPVYHQGPISLYVPLALSPQLEIFGGV